MVTLKTVYKWEEQFKSGNESVENEERSGRLLTDNLQMRRVREKFILRLLTEEQKESRVSVGAELKDHLYEDPDFKAKIATGDKSFVYGYDPEMKIQSSQWKSSNSPRPKKAKLKSNIEGHD